MRRGPCDQARLTSVAIESRSLPRGPYDAARSTPVGAVGFEPTTLGLKVRYSAIELDPLMITRVMPVFGKILIRLAKLA